MNTAIRCSQSRSQQRITTSWTWQIWAPQIKTWVRSCTTTQHLEEHLISHKFSQVLKRTCSQRRRWKLWRFKSFRTCRMSWWNPVRTSRHWKRSIWIKGQRSKDIGNWWMRPWRRRRANWNRMLFWNQLKKSNSNPILAIQGKIQLSKVENSRLWLHEVRREWHHSRLRGIKMSRLVRAKREICNLLREFHWMKLVKK